MKTKNYNYILVLLLILTFSCEKKSQKKISYENYFITGNVTITSTDTILDGPIKFYNDSSKLVSITNFKNNVKHGIEKDFSSTGKISQETNYYYGDQNGITKIYDFDGKIISQQNYYHGLIAGPQLFYKADSLSLYQFVNFENLELYHCRFKNGQAYETGNLLNYITRNVVFDGVKKLELFVYLIAPPYKESIYKVYDKDLKKKDSTLIEQFDSKQSFFRKVIFEYPKPGHIYYFKLQSYYPDKNILTDNLLKDNEAELIIPNEDENPVMVKEANH